MGTSIRRSCGTTDSRQTKSDAGCLGRDPGFVPIAGHRPTMREHPAVGYQVIGRGVADLGCHHIARPHRPIDFRPGGIEMHQPAVPGTTGTPCGSGVLTALTGGHQHLNGAADLGQVAA